VPPTNPGANPLNSSAVVGRGPLWVPGPSRGTQGAHEGRPYNCVGSPSPFFAVQAPRIQPMPIVPSASLVLLLQMPVPASPLEYTVSEGWTSSAVIEGQPFFVRLVGPSRTIAKWDASVQTFFKSLRVE